MPAFRIARCLSGTALLTAISLATIFPAGADIGTAQIANPAAGDWPAHGRDYYEQRFSPLKQINTGSVDGLGLQWFFDMPDRVGLQATPVVADGVMYVSGGWNRIYALDARTGALRWQHDPQVDRRVSYRFCCGAVNRGVALWGDKVYSATLDGRLIALKRDTGEQLWSTQTTNTGKNYSITGAPRIINGKVIIGNAGAEFGVRGYVSAYDANTGDMLWRFYTVPGNPADGFENVQMEMAAKTWNGEWWNVGGGGGTVWDAMAYDTDLNLLYIGVGNGGPHNRRLRSPGGGDNLFLSSIVALNPDTGTYVWHYQETPADNWDYTATQHIIVADITWEGKPRKVLLHAPKNGFFFIIDRETGKLLSAKPYTEVTWASAYDMATGRPIENPGMDYADKPALIKPSGVGGHNWHPMAFSPRTGLVYIPTIKLAAELQDIPLSEFVFHKRQWNLGYKTPETPDNSLFAQAILRAVTGGALLAWDPVQQKEVWQVKHSMLGNGGVLATDGGLVFQGTADANFSAYDAASGKQLWNYKTQNSIGAAPISYEIDGEQYVAVAAGLGGGIHLVLGVEHEPQPNGRVMVFKLGGKTALPDFTPPQYPEPPAIDVVDNGKSDVANGKISRQQIDHGRQLFHQYCYRCHGNAAVSDNELPDLRRLDAVWHQNFNKVLLEGLMEQAGMPRFDDVLKPEDADAIHAYVLHKANQDADFRNQPTWWLETQKWFYSRIAALIAKLV